MAHKITWLIPNQLLYIYFYDAAQHADLVEIIAAMDSAYAPPQPFYVVADGMDITWNQFRAADLHQLFQEITPLKQVTVVSVQPSRLNRYLSDLVFRVMGIQGKVMGNRQEAFEWLSSCGLASPHDLENQRLSWLNQFAKISA